MFYTNFLRLCNSIHKSPSAVAEEIGIKKSTVTRWKQGNSQTPANMQKVADYFGVTVEELTAEKENKPALPQENELDDEFIKLLTHNWGKLNSKRKELIKFIITTDSKVIDMMSTIADTIGKGNSENV